MCEDFAPNFGDKELALALLQGTVFRQAIFDMTLVLQPPSSLDLDPHDFSLFPA
jgi:hypothetical protein